MSDLERSLCGAICIDPKEVLPRVMDKVTAADFSDNGCSTLFDAATEMHSRGKVIDAQLIADAISKAFDTMDAAAAFVRECMERCPTVANAEVHAKRVHELARERAMHSILERYTYSDLSGDELAAALVGECQSFLHEESGGRCHDIGEILANVYREQSEKDTQRINTGFPKLDRILSGMTKGQLVLIAARPGVGKSAFAADIALTAARSGKPTLFCSMEMDENEVGERMVVRETELTLTALTNRGLDADQYRDLAGACSRISKWPIHVCDKPYLTTANIRALALSIPDISLIVVDYIGLLKPIHRNDSRNREIGDISKELKGLAKELRIPVIALSQLNRQTTDKERPDATNLRDSGELEQDADKILCLWNEDKESGVVGVSVAKNRKGETGVVYMRFDGAHMRYTELSDYQPIKPEKPKKEKPF